jgi:hypothetical protein
MTDPIKPTDLQVVRELAQGAKALQDDRAFKVAVAALENQWYGEMLMAQTVEEKLDRVAKLSALKAIPKMLDSLIASEKMAQRRSNG